MNAFDWWNERRPGGVSLFLSWDKSSLAVSCRHRLRYVRSKLLLCFGLSYFRDCRRPRGLEKNTVPRRVAPRKESIKASFRRLPPLRYAPLPSRRSDGATDAFGYICSTASRGVSPFVARASSSNHSSSNSSSSSSSSTNQS